MLRKKAQEKITHPLAKYNNIGQLVCRVCTTVVKHETLWDTHLNSKKHKEAVELLKQKAATQTQKQTQPTQTPTKTSVTVAGEKKVKVVLPSGPSSHFASSNQKTPLASTKQAKRGEEEERKSEVEAEAEAEAETQAEAEIKAGAVSSGVNPADSSQENSNKDSDSNNSNTTTTTNTNTNTNNNGTQNSKGTNSTNSLPAGFFDDPKSQPQAPPQLEAEWSKFKEQIDTIVEENREGRTQEEEEEEEEEEELIRLIIESEPNKNSNKEKLFFDPLLEPELENKPWKQLEKLTSIKDRRKRKKENEGDNSLERKKAKEKEQKKEKVEQTKRKDDDDSDEDDDSDQHEAFFVDEFGWRAKTL